MTDHPITPPPELTARLWREASAGRKDAPIGEIFSHGVQLAYAAGADQELEACCEQMQSIPSPLGIPFGEMASNALRAARRPKPPSLKEQALAVLNDWCEQENGPGESIICNGLHVHTIRRALEALDD